MVFYKINTGFILNLVSIGLLTAGPVKVTLHHPPPGQFGIEKLWWVEIDNPTQNTYDSCYLQGEILEATKGLVFRANSRKFQLPPGKKILRGRKDVDPLWDVWHAPGYEKFAARTGGLPEGNYTFIVLLQPDLGGDTVEFQIRLPGPPRLISPRDGTKIPHNQKQPMFNWTPPTSPPPGIKYRLRIVEILPGQTKEEAMRSNQPWYEGKNFTNLSLRYPLSARSFASGKQFAWQVEILDQTGATLNRSEIWAFSIEELLPPLLRLLRINMTREVTRTNNYYRVQLTIENNSSDTFYDLSVFDRSSELQCLDDATVMHGTTGASYRASWCSTWANSNGNLTAIRFGWERLNPGGRMIVRYHLVPVFSHYYSLNLGSAVVGDSTIISYRIGDRWYLVRFRIQFLPTDIADARRAADYLIITTPERLFRDNPPGTENDVYRLLATMARLAKEKNGVLGYTSALGTDPIQYALSYSWGTLLTPTWRTNGYLLIVGQNNIISAFTVPVEGFPLVPLSDYPYSNLSGDEQCELRVGRIIGLTATELTIPIQTSLDVWQGRARYDGSRGLMVSAAEGPFEDFVMQTVELSDSLRRKVSDVFSVLGEMFITRIDMLREALWIDSYGDLFKLSRWALREWVWNGHALGTIDRLSEVEALSRNAVQDSAIALARRLIPADRRPDNDIDLVAKAMWDYIILGEDAVPRREQYLRALARWLLAQRGITPPADTVGRALREGEEIQFVRRGQRVPVYNYRDTPEAAGQDRSSYVRQMAQDRDILGYRGHGGPGSWGWVLDDWVPSPCPAEPLSFGSHRPVVLGFTCSSGDYTERGAHGPVSIARCFLRNGAGIYVGATRRSYCCTNKTLYLETFRRWSTQEYFGDAFVDLKNTACLREHGWILETVMYNLYGDPKYRRR